MRLYLYVRFLPVILFHSLIGNSKIILSPKNSKPNLTVIGKILYSDGIGRLAISIIDMLRQDLSINLLPVKLNNSFLNLKDMPAYFKDLLITSTQQPSDVALYVYLLWSHKEQNLIQILPLNSKIKLAYSMLESTKIPQQWVSIINKQFDAVIVPDKFLVDAYQSSGVTKPIFVLPIPLELAEIQKLTPKRKEPEIFTFGMSAEFIERKNHLLLLDSFIECFGSRADVRLILHGRAGYPFIIETLERKIKKRNYKNIKVIYKRMDKKEYFDFLLSLDCYVFVSKGEGFSITPREALAIGIPCIVTNNTAQKTLCESGFVKAVDSLIIEKAYYSIFKQICGFYFNTTKEEIKKALLDIYHNYDFWLNKSKLARAWVMKYAKENLKHKYLSLIKPKKVVFGDGNILEDDYLMTNSLELYNKYKEILSFNEYL